MTSQVWCTFNERHLGRQCCEKSLSDLKVDYIDLFLMHRQMGCKVSTVSFATEQNNWVI